MKYLLVILLLFTKTQAQVPYGLNSNPTARPTAFLDFDGQTVDDPFWRPFNGDSIVYCNQSLLNNASMIKVFNHVSEDFRAFNINITTDSAVYFAAPINKRTRVIITPTFRWYGTSGGVAYIESFRWGLNTPCFVFDTLLGQNDKRVAEAASHEIGHTLGLYHQSQYRNIGTDSCTFGSEYFAGRGSGDIAWAPIMGNSYDRNMGVWHIGQTLTCTTVQNDLNVITNIANGITYRADDHGNTINLSTPVTITNGNYFIGGIINDSIDSDFFQFEFNVPGRFIANINPFNSGPPNIRSGLLIGVINYNGNVDLEVTLFRNNTQIRTYNPTTLLSVSIDTLLEPGNYFLKINTAPNINIFKSAMLGSYTITGSFGGSVVVPIRSINIKGFLSKNEHVINWEILSDDDIEDITLESSNDAIKYKSLFSSKEKIYTYNYRPLTNESYYYRVKVISAGQIYYSDPILIRGESYLYYNIFSNPIYSNLIVNSKSVYIWQLVDLTGKVIDGGRFTPGLNYIDMNKRSIGTYILRIFVEKNSFFEKVIKL